MRPSDGCHRQVATRGAGQVGPQFPCRMDLGPWEPGSPPWMLQVGLRKPISQWTAPVILEALIPGRMQDAERRPGHLVESAGRGTRDLCAEAAQRRDQCRQGDLPADPDGGREHMQEQPDGVPVDREHRHLVSTCHRSRPRPGAPARAAPARSGRPQLSSPMTVILSLTVSGRSEDHACRASQPGCPPVMPPRHRPSIPPRDRRGPRKGARGRPAGPGAGDRRISVRDRSALRADALEPASGVATALVPPPAPPVTRL